ncbi:hypothetical protein [Clostridium folliculivorans]|uniref:Uncharacterized protein n=1 Tax=Clostridium folliculivorans TaxID=2886038 RepID=A0A9W5Y2C3_9CLOT|nr:hypothetical protein [Clostridium folliculivorans]GKU25265.1 hypothetical protein CFOLD11_20910 [Clostridium folliculivorans]GKU28286.1 hypothetical protein CFB3_03920 [Clostridium folliculivorans]
MKKKILLISAILLLIISAIILFIGIREDNNTARITALVLILVVNILNIFRNADRWNQEK